MVPITASIPLGTTAAQTSTPLIFGTLPPLTRVIATVTDADTHYSTVMTTSRGGTSNDDVHITDYDSSDSEQEHDTPPRRRRDIDHTRNRRRRHRQETNEPRGATNQTYEDRIRAYEEEIARLKRDQARLPPPEPRDKNPRQTSMNKIHLLPAGDPDNPVPPFTQEIMGARISRKFKLPTIKAYDGTGDDYVHVTDYDSTESEQEHDTPPSKEKRCRPYEPRGATNQAYEDRIRAYEEEIA